MDEVRSVTVPGCTACMVAFHPMTKTEQNYDYVTFYRDASKPADGVYGEPKYHGRPQGNFPGLNGVPPLLIPAATFAVHMKSDGSGNDWGYRCVGQLVAQCSSRNHFYRYYRYHR
jgi:hypothetical protein